MFALSQAVAKRCFMPQRSGNSIVAAPVAALRVGELGKLELRRNRS